MTYAECIDFLQQLGHELRGVKFDLAVIQALLEALGNPHLRYPSIIVAGTNGKGSACAMIASILERAGYRTGLYTSPHLVRVNERIRLNGRDISDGDFAAALSEVRERAEYLRSALPQRPSFFEYLTAAAFLSFARDDVQFAVLEVGMGGRLDATNVTEPRVAIITNVELDHQEFLGNTVAAIAREKAGVIKPNRPVISGAERPEAAEVIRGRCLELSAELLELPRDATACNVRNQGGWFSFDLTLKGRSITGLAPALAGRFQVQNAMAAVAAALELRERGFSIPLQAIRQGLRRARWPGRLDVIARRPMTVLDGAHNPAAALELAAFAREQFRGRRVRLVYASMRDKAIEEISAILFPIASEVYVTQVATARAATPEEILRRAGPQRGRIMIEPDAERALNAALEASSREDVVLAAGSLFLVGAALEARGAGRLGVKPVVKENQSCPN
ncbi:MAG: bifunctional folylpolyglutamate synthase/dihydrofolate synthase [Terriglobia bacterium]